MFWHNYKYAFKTLLKNRALVFWTLAFPFILAILFNLAFARLHDYDVFEAIDVAVVNDAEYEKATVFSEAIKSVSEGDKRVFNTQYIDAMKASELLEDNEIVGYIYIEKDVPHVKVNGNGSSETVLQMTVEQIAQSSKMIEDIAMTDIYRRAGQTVNIEEIYRNAVKIVAETEPNIKDDSHVMNVVSIEFYTLIAMACMQGAMLSVEMMNRCMPNISNRGKRVAVAPTRKSTMILSNILAGYTMLLAAVVALILFTRYILGIEYGSDMRSIILLAAVGSLTATTMGMLLSVALKTNESAKNVIVLIVTMVGCLFAGMFGGQKGLFDAAMPLINKISPVGMITDGYYSLLYYGDSARFTMDVVSLLIVAGVFFALSIRSLRRQRYDSI